MVTRVKKPEAEKPTAGDLRHSLSNSAGQLLSFVERFERISEEIGGLMDDRKEILGEAKGTGFDVAAIRRQLSLRKLDKAARQEREALDELYSDTLDKAEAAQFAASLEAGV